MQHVLYNLNNQQKRIRLTFVNKRMYNVLKAFRKQKVH